MKNKIIILILLLPAVLFSCEDSPFLKEEPRSVETSDTKFSTETGLRQLINACYVSSKIWYGAEEGYDMSDIGTDLYTWAEQHPTPNFFEYTTTHDSRHGRLIVLWIEFYRGINACNEALFYLNNESPFSEEETNRFKSEVRFLRALYFYHLTEMYGEIDMPTTRTEGAVTDVELVSVDSVYTQIKSDLNYAINNLGESTNMSSDQYGRVTQDAARSFRARVNFTIASYKHYAGEPDPYSFPSQPDATTLFDSAYQDANALINDGQYTFYEDYRDLWAFENNAGNWNNENIWAVNYSRNEYSMLNVDPSTYEDFTDKPWSEREGGHHGHLMWGMEYRIIPGMTRVMEYGRTFRRYFPTKHFIDMYVGRTEYDARFKGQFRTTWKAVQDTSEIDYPTWGNYGLEGGDGAYIPDTASAGDTIYTQGDTALHIRIGDYPDDRLARPLDNGELQDGQVLYLYVDGPYFVLDNELMWNADNDPATPNNDGTWNRQMYIQPDKFDDPQRLVAEGDGSERGARDAMVFRLAEMYMIAAESAVRGSQGQGRAVELLKEYRRSRALPGHEDQMANEIDNATLDKYFFLTERAREFVGEQLRWFDLKRTHSRQGFVDYITSNNPDASPGMEPHNYLRPYPQPEIDAVTNPEEFGDNNGY